MNPDQPSREQIETRLTALLLGELPAEEAALLRYTLSQDPALQQLHDELQSTLVLVKEAAKHPAEPATDKNAPLKLSADRRQKLLAHFQTPRPKPEPLFWLKRITAPSLVRVLAAIALVAFIAALLLPALSKSKNGLPRGTYGSVSFPSLSFRVWSGNDEESDAAQEKTSSATALTLAANRPPTSSPTPVALTPEPKLAPPPAAPPVQIFLPASQLEAGQLADNDGTHTVSEEQRLPGVSDAAAEDAAYERSLIDAQRRRELAKTQPISGVTPFGGSIGGNGQLANTEDRRAHVEKQWILPKTGADSVNLTRNKNGSDVPNSGPVVGVVNAFAGEGGFRSGGGGGSFGGATAQTDANGRVESGKSVPAGTGGEPFSASANATVAFYDSGMNRSLAEDKPAAGFGFSLLGPATHSDGKAQDRIGKEDVNFEELSRRSAPPAALGGTMATMTPATPTVNSQTGLPALALNKTTGEYPSRQLASGTRAPDAGPAANTYYRLPDAAPEKKVETLGDIPFVGRLPKSEAVPSEMPVAVTASPVPTGSTFDANTFHVDSDFKTKRPEATKALDKSSSSTWALNGPISFSAGKAFGGTSPSDATLGVPIDSLSLSRAKEDAGGLSYLSPRDQPSAPAQKPEDRSQFIGRYGYVTTNLVNNGNLAALGDQFQQQEQDLKSSQARLEKLRRDLKITDQDPHSFTPTPTMDVQQLQAINQQKMEGEKVYREQLTQLQELKSIQKTDKEKLAVVLPQMVQDPTLNELLAKRHEAQQKLVVEAYDQNPSKARTQSTIEELNRQIDDRTTGIMASLENQVNAKGAALNAMTSAVQAAKAKDVQEAQKNQPYYDAKRELEQKSKMHELLYSKLQSENLDLNLPKSSMVQITDPAEPSRNQTFWQRLNGQYASTARVKVENDASDISGMTGSPTVSGTYDPYFIQTAFEIIQSEKVLGQVVEALNLQTAWASSGTKLTKSAATAMLKQRLELKPVPNTKLISISAKSSTPVEAAKLANAVASAYANYRMESRKALTTNRLTVLREQFEEQSEEIRLAQAKVESLSKSLSPVQPTVDQSDVPLRKPAPNTPLPQPEILASENAFSTFSLNVSDVSFKLAEASLQNGKLPDTASIRSEEFINAFDYRDPEAAPGQPLAFASERARYTFAHNRDLLRFSVKTAAAGRPAGRALNLVLLLDNSGSMERADRVGIIREALHVLTTQLQPQDTVSVVTFARTARLWADGVSGDKAGETLGQIGGITPEGGTNLEEAMRLAYETARRHYLANGMNRVVLLTDGAANLGDVDPSDLKEKVEAQRKQGIALDCFGIGWEDFNDDLLEQLSSNGDGRYAFLNSPEDVAKEFAAKLAGALQVAAADVKVQVEFNPKRVVSYRQIGYAKHQLTKEQFRDNTVDAAEIAAQEAGNALYTIETKPDGEGPIATVHVRYKIPGTSDYRERSWDVAYDANVPALAQASPAMRLAATASAFSEWLAASPFAQQVTPDELLKQLSGVPEIYGADTRPKQLETMIREAKSLEGK